MKFNNLDIEIYNLFKIVIKIRFIFFIFISIFKLSLKLLNIDDFYIEFDNLIDRVTALKFAIEVIYRENE